VSELLLVVKADHNDADWITKVTPISLLEFDQFYSLIKAIKNFKPYRGKSASGLKYTHDHNWPVGDYGCRQDLGAKTITELYGALAEEFDEKFVPHAENWNVHTIEEIYTVRKELVLL
jgi:hypothetical protein